MTSNKRLIHGDGKIIRAVRLVPEQNEPVDNFIDQVVYLSAGSGQKPSSSSFYSGGPICLLSHRNHPNEFTRQY